MSERRTSVTIAIPTFNRADSVLRRVEEISEYELPSGTDVLVIDNHSPDGTFARLTERFGTSDIRILRNERNLGLAGNVFRAIKEATTDYVLLLSDEDRLDVNGFRRLVDFCHDRVPDYVSPQAQVGTDAMYRGRRTSSVIEPEGFEASSFYISGLTFSSRAAQEVVGVLEPLMQTNSAVAVYPQVAIASLLVAQGNSYFFDALVSRQMDSLESMITDPSGISYYGVAGRWSQFLGFEKLFAADYSDRLPNVDHARLARMCVQTRKNIQGLIADGAIREVPELEPYLRVGSFAARARIALGRLLGRG